MPLGATCSLFSAPANFIAGADLSLLTFFEQRGIAYRDAGQAQDALAILKQRGLTCVRLRLFTSSAAQAQADPYNYINNVDYTLALAKRVKAAGFQFMLDFHYSDTWADPGHQSKPAGWTNLTFLQLVQQMRDYNSNTIAAFQAAGVMPDYVQVGNEITSGLLWPDGRVGGSYETPAQWAQLGQLLKAAVRGIREASGPQLPGIMVHIDRGGDWNTTQWFFDNLQQQQVPFDMIGQSYYPFWHGPMSSLANCLTNAAVRYDKPVVVVETGFPWTNSVWGSNIVGLAPAPSNQVTFLAALAAVEKRVPAGLGGGIFWWGAEYQRLSGVNEAGFDSASFFDTGGNALPITEAFGSLMSPTMLTPSRDQAMLMLSWPLSLSGTFPATSTNPAAFATWLTVTNVVQTNAAGYELRLPISPGTCRFYRLQPD